MFFISINGTSSFNGFEGRNVTGPGFFSKEVRCCKTNNVEIQPYREKQPTKNTCITSLDLSPIGFPCQFSSSSILGNCLPLNVLAKTAVGRSLVFCASWKALNTIIYFQSILNIFNDIYQYLDQFLDVVSVNDQSIKTKCF